MNSKQICRFASDLYGCNIYEKEVYAALIMKKNNIIGVVRHTLNSVDKCVFHTSEIINKCIDMKGDGVVFIHNHPTSGLMPSNQDKASAISIEKHIMNYGLKMYDFIIVGKDCMSFRHNNMFKHHQHNINSTLRYKLRLIKHKIITRLIDVLQKKLI